MDVTHHFVEKGSGEPLILLHGNGENCGYFKKQLDVFAELYRVIALDTRGHGQTPRGDAPFTIRQFSEDLLGFMDEHGIERTHILGFSDGGNIAMVFAMAYPERVARLILNGANLTSAGVKLSTQLPIELGYRIAKLSSRKSEKARAHSELLGLMVNDPNVRPEELQGITARTLVIAGTKDVIKQSETRRIAAAIPDSRLVFIPGDHFIARRNPEAFNRAVLDFLTDGQCLNGSGAEV
jgi:pimeloyl-ACP methyl ester carboxylesterase